MKHWNVLFQLVVLWINLSFGQEDDDNEIVNYLTKNKLLQGRAEVVFLLDRSGSVGGANFEIEKGFVESFLSHVVVDANATRVAVISYSDTVERHIDYIREPKTKCFLSLELQDVAYRDSGATNIAAALDEARIVLQNARPNVNKVVIMISDGLATAGGDPYPSAKRLKEERGGVQLFTFGIGRFLKSELMALATSPKHTYVCKGFKEFNRLARKIRGDPHENAWSGDTLSTPSCDHLCDSPYKGQPDDPGCCDHYARCSCALLSGVHTCVCGPGYFGLSGTPGRCRACPKGTYKSRLEPTTRCTPCPQGSTTDEEASTSIRDCYCKEGYVGDPAAGSICAIVKCPPFQKPTNGLLLGDCRHEFGSDCLVTCKEGFELADRFSDIRTCESNGQWSGSAAVCRRILCNGLPAPKFGTKRCDGDDLTVGKTCRFRCNLGFILSGSETRECLPSKKWSGVSAECISIECPIPESLLHGTIINCLSHIKPIYEQTCYLKCNAGYQLNGSPYLICNSEGKLVDDIGLESNPYCTDVMKPEIACPRTVVQLTDPGRNFAFVNWNVPVPRDNSGFTPKLEVIPKGLVPSSKFHIGTSSITYKATDRNGNSASCAFSIHVVDKESPKVMSCPSKIETNTSDLQISVEWQEPIFKDNSGDKLIITKSADSGDVFEIGSHIVSYEAKDSKGNTARCSFEIIVAQNYCPYHPAPVNGAFTCEDWMYGQFCQTYCNDQYDFVDKPAEWYVCNSDAKWETLPPGLPIPWPDCSKRHLSTSVRQMLSGFYYKGDCRNPQVQRAIRKTFLRHFTASFDGRDFCISEGACTIEMVKVTCGKVDPHAPLARSRRDVWQRAAKEEFEVEFEITLNPDQQIEITEELLQEFLDAIQNVTWDVDDELTQELSSVELHQENVGRNDLTPHGSLVVTSERTLFLCPPGSFLENRECVSCPPGTYSDNSMNECLDCPIGMYQEEEGHQACLLCPVDTSTENARCRNMTDCKGICTPGTYSPNGLETCVSCPLGTYQNELGQIRCNLCPNGTTTATEGSSSIQNCQKTCDPGSFSTTGLEPCILCSRGYYQPFEGQTECLECASNLSTVTIGQRFSTDCIDYDPCAEDYRCDHGGSCIEVGRDVSCQCMPGFIGDFCQEDINECLEGPCLNNGTCVNTDGSFQCTCNNGFQGKTCAEEINECHSEPCLNNGTCLYEVGGYLCVCPTGYEGMKCESKLELCSHDVICLNGGVCVLLPGNMLATCNCPDGFNGSDCSININECENVTCRNGGVCIDGLASFHCVCSEGFAGSMCEFEVNECDNHQCFGGSTCEDLIGAYNCICPPGMSGSRCEHQLSSDFVLMFPDDTSTLGNMASMTLKSALSEATVSMWVQTTDIQRSGTPLSYAVSATASTTNQISNDQKEDTITVDNALTISDCSGLTIYVNNQPLVTDTQVADGKWHHIAFTWTSENLGEWSLYQDGKLTSSGQGLQSGERIPGGGNLVMGQEQDEVGGGFNPLETFTGNISRLNIWSEYFSNKNVTRLCNLEDDLPGKVVSWPDFLGGIRGDVRVLKDQKPSLAMVETSISHN